MSAKERGVAGGSRAPASAAPARADRERARGRGAGQNQPWEARGARGVGVAWWARTSAAPGFAEEKGHFSVLLRFLSSIWGLPSSQSLDVSGGKGRGVERSGAGSVECSGPGRLV